MKRKSHFRHTKSRKISDDDYEFSEEYKAEDSRLIEVEGSLSPLMSFISIVLLILFTMYLIAVKHSGGKITSPKEAISDFFMPMRSDYYEMRVDEDFEANTNEEVSKFMQDNGYSDSLKTSAFNRNTAMYLKQEDGRSVTLPGSYGSTTFYIKPKKADADLSIHITYDVFAVTELADGSLVKMSEVDCSDTTERKCLDNIDELLNGHILFFRENCNGKYSGLIENGEMIYRTSEHMDDLNASGEYKIKVYWIWAEYYEQLVNTQADGALFDNSDQQAEMLEYIKNNPDEFLCTAEIGAIPDGTEMTDYDILSDYYDNGDKLIIENTKYFGFNVRTYAE
ncbi:hypothetical protein [Ruminococcus albus]|uniref:Uncharacterized protein n=1 Tax=Ruminococcus albus (strain ATCC 27210 / DSM 20455 / JCM 14654 / NCDO 2250 / 7) TaxID=697329 RepID=E6UCT0_RUMA7|nr:hypothetical protein [Ruminococcus albus]ADU22759.1 hypothetical protein Rumal_2274 [Ruminococcus albus 7 = DSM 20455]ADU24358.1 hypothetical protein Rumal_3935 [Ruminococcus albus 7 = DSM 20455]